jgi:hypothetical protein
MRRVREVLRLRHALGMSDRLIAQSLGIGKTTVGEYVCRAKVIGITWPVPEEIDDAELERRLFTAPLVRGEAEASAAGLVAPARGAQAARQAASSRSTPYPA